ncbi:hypothetical protein Syun_014040 [Stephania yunnanensis]|uniref:Uncharacterized protein n=1 Tax=Stephania yunnanensis TaxID=152371 RepID=A0AAP0PBE7_9MAGN
MSELIKKLKGALSFKNPTPKLESSSSSEFLHDHKLKDYFLSSALAGLSSVILTLVGDCSLVLGAYLEACAGGSKAFEICDEPRKGVLGDYV